MANESPDEAIIVPYQDLSDAALRGVVEAFVLREGTDYGAREFTLAEKAAHVMCRLEQGEAELRFDPKSNTVDIMRVRTKAGRCAD